VTGSWRALEIASDKYDFIWESHQDADGIVRIEMGGYGVHIAVRLSSDGRFKSALITDPTGRYQPMRIEGGTRVVIQTMRTISTPKRERGFGVRGSSRYTGSSSPDAGTDASPSRC
jgi:hypothetical protein